jgi:uncharacterized membrane protein
MIEPGQPPRGMSVHRVEALSDGVFAIAMTVLVLGIRVPEGGDAAGLSAQLSALWPKFASYAMSFVMLGVLWIGHHFQFQYIRRTDRPLLWLNILFLLAVTFLPFSTAVLGNYYEARIAIVLYGMTVVVAGACLLAHWAYATRKRHLVSADLDESVVASIRKRITVGMVLSFAATAAGFVATKMSLAIFLALPTIYLVRSRVDRHIAERDLHS